MAIIKNIWLEKITANNLTDPNVLAIRIDWDNDRHQRIEINPPHGSREVIEALICILNVLNREEKAGEI